MFLLLECLVFSASAFVPGCQNIVSTPSTIICRAVLQLAPYRLDWLSRGRLASLQWSGKKRRGEERGGAEAELVTYQLAALVEQLDFSNPPRSALSSSAELMGNGERMAAVERSGLRAGSQGHNQHRLGRPQGSRRHRVLARATPSLPSHRLPPAHGGGGSRQ